MLTKQITGTLIVASLIAGLHVRSPWAQETEGGVQFTIDVNSRISANSNLDLDASSPGSTFRSDTALTFGLLSETRTQRLALSVGTVLRFADGPSSSGTDFEEPTLDLSYRREGPRSSFSFDANYRERDLDSSTLVFDPTLGTSSIETSSGTRTDARWETVLDLGTAGPVGVRLTFGQRFVEYENVTNTSLFDQEITSGDALVTLTFSPVLTGTAQVLFRHFEAEDSTNTRRDTEALTFGLIYTPDARTEITANIGARRIDDSVSGTSNGIDLDLAYTRALPRGSFTVEGETALTVAGQRNQVEVSRLFEFPWGEFEVGAGLTHTEGTSTEPTFNLRYSHALARGEITARLSQSVSVSNDQDVQQVLRGDVGYTHALNSLTQLALGITYVDVNDIGGTGFTERERGSVTASVSRTLTSDWSLSVGASHRFLKENGTTSRDNAIFADIGRSFTFRP